jgi:cytochrome c oxidase subunit 2
MATLLPWLPENVSTYGAQIDSLFYLIFWITSITFVLVQGTLIVFLVQYRYRPGRQATYTHGNNTLEIAWTIAPSIILIVLALLSRGLWHEIKETLPPSKYPVQVTAKQFNWEITYPGPDGKLGTADDVTMDNDLHVPVNKTIRIVLKARDVIHSYFVPAFRLKQDAVPGHEIPVWFKAVKAGKYEVPCAELCGYGHSGMKGWLYVHTPEEYDAWAKEKGVATAAPAPAQG